MPKPRSAVRGQDQLRFYHRAYDTVRFRVGTSVGTGTRVITPQLKHFKAHSPDRKHAKGAHRAARSCCLYKHGLQQRSELFSRNLEVISRVRILLQ